jgi:hypothetical protein
LIDEREPRRAEVLKDRIKKFLFAARFKIAQGCFRERDGNATTVDELFEKLGLSLGPDFFRERSGVCASAFFKADSADRAPDIEEGTFFGAVDDFEGHGRAS